MSGPSTDDFAADVAGMLRALVQAVANRTLRASALTQASLEGSLISAEYLGGQSVGPLYTLNHRLMYDGEMRPALEQLAPRRAVGYLRVSTDEQAESGAGLAAQESAIRADIDRRGSSLVALYRDAGISGKTMAGRPGLERALHAIDNAEADTLVVAKLDRLSRSLLDFAGLMARAQRDGWNLVALDLGIDLSTPAGEFMASVVASAAQWERRIIGQRTRDALEAKRAAGVRLGRPRTVARDVVDRIMAERTSGRTFVAIADGLNADAIPTARGGLRWYPSTVRAVLESVEKDKP